MKKAYPSDKQDQYMIRFPDGMRDRIKEAAEDVGRSMNQEIVARLESSFDLSMSDKERLAFFEEMYEQNNRERNELIDTINKQDLIVQQMKREHQTLVLLARSISHMLLADEAIPAQIKAMAQLLDQLEEDNEADRSEELEKQPWEYE